MKDMVTIRGGTFLMGSDDFYPEESPVHEVTVDTVLIDEHQVTVAEFRRFNYCLRYRPAARSSETVDTSTAHIGFRCVVRDIGEVTT